MGQVVSAHQFFTPDNQVDIGASGATRPKNVYIGTKLYAPVAQLATGAGVGKVLGCDASGNTSWVGGRRLIERIVANGSSGSINFANIPADYKSLHVIITGRSDLAAAYTDNPVMRFNGDSSSIYDYQTISGYSSVSLSNESFGNSYFNLGYFPASSTAAGMAASLVITVPAYTQGWEKTMHSSCAGKYGTASSGFICSNVWGAWRNTAVITQLNFIMLGGGHWYNGSVAELYGDGD